VEDPLLDIGNDIRSLSDFKRKTGEFVDRVRASGHPLALTINGKAELVVQDAASCQTLVDRVDTLDALEGIKRGLADVFSPRCSHCGSVEFRGVGVRNTVERAAHWFFLPYRCSLCGRHFFLFRWMAPEAGLG
jgi:prevent-host-death family protein